MAGAATIKRRKPWLAVLLSFVTTGLGQFYNGQWRKGVGFFLAETVLGLLMVMGMGSFSWLVTGVILLLAFNLCVAYEAFLSARGAQEYVLLPSNRGWMYALIIVANLVVGTSLDYLAKGFFYQSFKVPSGSMMQTLQVGDHFMAEILSDTAAIERKDITVFLLPNGDKYFVKRVIGLPGDSVSIEARTVYINGQPLDEPYAYHSKEGNQPVRDDFGPVNLGPDEYFLMGDNREASYDSRWLGPIKRTNILSRAQYIYFPGQVGSPEWFDRLGMELR